MEYSLISIGRQFGSGGHKVGQLIADELGLPYYDKELLTMAARRGSLSEKKVERLEDKKQKDYKYEDTKLRKNKLINKKNKFL